MLLPRIIEANFAEIDAAIAVRHLKVSGLLLFSADACPSTWSRKSCTAELVRSQKNDGRHNINQRTTDVWQVRQVRQVRQAWSLHAGMQCKGLQCALGDHNMMQAGSPQVESTAGALCALVSCSAPAPTPASDQGKHCLYPPAAALLPVQPHPAARCRPAQMRRCKPAAIIAS